MKTPNNKAKQRINYLIGLHLFIGTVLWWTLYWIYDVLTNDETKVDKVEQTKEPSNTLTPLDANKVRPDLNTNF